MNFKENLINLIESKNAVIGIYGLGYVGLPMALNYAMQDYKVIGFDINKEKIKNLLEGKSEIKSLDGEKIKELILKGSFKPTTDFSLTKIVDAILICVPTPLTKYREPDLSFIYESIELIKKYSRKGQVISLESTTYPGTTDEEIKPRIESNGLKVGDNYFLVYSPEREDPGNKKYNSTQIPKIVSGSTKNCLDVGIVLYKKVIKELVKVSNTRTAEMTKLLENIHRSVNIGLVNELKPLAKRMDIDIFEVIRAASTKPFGFVPYFPGPGLGGHCIPIDPFYLTWKAKEYGMHVRFIELAGEVNISMPNYVVDQIIIALNDYKMSINGSNILILGVAYKRNIEDIRESPAIDIIKYLLKKGANLTFSDPYVDNLPANINKNISKVDLNQNTLISQDAVVLITDHDEFDYELIRKSARIIVDTRGRFPSANNIYQG